MSLPNAMHSTNISFFRLFFAIFPGREFFYGIAAFCVFFLILSFLFPTKSKHFPLWSYLLLLFIIELAAHIHLCLRLTINPPFLPSAACLATMIAFLLPFVGAEFPDDDSQ